MKKLIILIITAIVLVGVVVFTFSGNNGEEPVLSLTPTASPNETSENTILYSDSGYSPSTLNIKKGDIVTFKNAGSKMMWTASAMHPNHKGYSGTDIALCGTQMMMPMFDACKGYGAGELWEFRFDEPGTWKYHNHLQPNHSGAVIVD